MLRFFLISLLLIPIKASGQNSSWKGFERIELEVNGKKGRLVKPNIAKKGNPWVWRARFPDWHTETDSLLLSQGFHIAYINTDNQYGSPKAMNTWDLFYQTLIEKYHLNTKVALEGVSRGGLFVHNWAKNNVTKVACIYAEAPVCDFKSWPGGFGNSKGSPEVWQKLKDEYGFNSDEEAKAYTNLPIDGLENLAAAKVPILHMISLNDEIVPYEENSKVLINKYIELGGDGRIIACTKGKQSLRGHHFEIETPQLVADFIKYSVEQAQPISSEQFHQLRYGIKNAQKAFEETKKGRIAFLGGSITQNGGWRDSLMAYFVRKFPETNFEFIPAGIASMGSTPAAFRLERDILSKGKIDLLFEEAAVNDHTNGRSAEEQIRAMEGIVRHLKNVNPEIDIILMHFADPDKTKQYRVGEIPEVIQNHEKVASHYGLPSINLAKEVQKRLDHNEFSWEDDFKELHPSPFGQGIYAKSMIAFLENAFSSSEKAILRVIPDPIDSYNYQKGELIDISKAKIGKGWKIVSNWSPSDGTVSRPNYTNVPMLVADTPESTLKLKFNGSAVGIAVAAGKDAGTILYRVDKGEWKVQNLFTQWSTSLHLPWYYTLESELDKSEHMLELKIGHAKDARSTGTACRIRYFYVNGEI